MSGKSSLMPALISAPRGQGLELADHHPPRRCCQAPSLQYRWPPHKHWEQCCRSCPGRLIGCSRPSHEDACGKLAQGAANVETVLAVLMLVLCCCLVPAQAVDRNAQQRRCFRHSRLAQRWEHLYGDEQIHLHCGEKCGYG
eukprot:1187911-Pleurochrysis_carterae.AAC.2